MHWAAFNGEISTIEMLLKANGSILQFMQRCGNLHLML